MNYKNFLDFINERDKQLWNKYLKPLDYRGNNLSRIRK